MPVHELFDEDLKLFGEGGASLTLSLDETLSLMRPTTGPAETAPDREFSNQAEVAVVGAGPVGMTAALLLAHYGIDTVLLEKNETTSSLPRAIAIDDEYVWRRLSRFN